MGRGAFKKDGSQITSIDCSGLTNLLYRSQGIEIARDAHDQRLQCKEIAFEELQPADLIFIAADVKRPNHTTHVMLYKEGDTMLEACMDAGCVRWITAEQKLGRPLNEIKSGDIVNNNIVWFGTFEDTKK